MKTIGLLAAAICALTCASGTALAGGAKQASLGTPGLADCVGASIASLAQTGEILGVPGVEGLARTSGLDVGQVQGAVAAYCASGSSTETAEATKGGGGGGSGPSCDDARDEAAALNAIADSEDLAAQGFASAGLYADQAIHAANAQILRSTGQAIVSSSCGPQ